MTPPRARPPVSSIVLGVLGEILVTLGVLLGLFLAWQLWWTDVVAAREQDRVVEDLGWAQTLEEAEPALPADTGSDEPPVLAEPLAGETFATLQVPRWGADYLQPISQGVGRDILDGHGLGHYPGTAMPGDVGNVAVAGHRTTYGRPLHRVAELELGDPLVVQTEDAWFVYRVTSTTVVRPEQVEVIAPEPPGYESSGGQVAEDEGRRLLTLTTCHPLFSAAERFIVHAELESWAPAADGPPTILEEGA